MASSSSSSSVPLGRNFAIVALCCMLTASCNYAAVDPLVDGPVAIVDRALECFHDHYVYSSCQEEYRLKAEGSIHVPPEEVDEYCGGACLAETKLVLKCVDEILYNFRFYNGASIRDASRTLESACGHGGERGDFDISKNIGADLGYDDFYYGHGNGNKIPISSTTPLILILIFAAALLQLY